MAGSFSRRTAVFVRGAVVAALVAAGAACGSAEPPRRYPLTGQVLAVHTARNELTVKHQDIPNFMPGMTMTFAVDPPSLMEGRTPGELIEATLEVESSTARLVEIRSTGSAPLPSENEMGMAAGLLAAGDEVPDVALIDQNNRRRTLAEWKGSLTLVTFIYTRCPLANFCPLMDQNFATIQNAVAEDRTLAGHVRLISVTFDPEHDTPEVLAAHAAKRRANPDVWTFLTGDTVTIQRLAGRFGVSVVPSDGAEISHNLRTVLIGADGRIRRFYSGNDWTPSAVLADLRAARAGS